MFRKTKNGEIQAIQSDIITWKLQFSSWKTLFLELEIEQTKAYMQEMNLEV